MYIDTHVHCRDLDEKHKETIEHALYVAEKTGATAICAEPNTQPPLIDKAGVLDYLNLAKEAKSPVEFYVWVGITMKYNSTKHFYEIDQLCRAVDLVNSHPQVVGLKFFPCHSVNDLAVLQYDCQEMVFTVLDKLGYEGPLQVHGEDEDTNKQNQHKWLPDQPWTWDEARPEISEMTAVKRIIGYAQKHHFKGKLHFAHLSSPKPVEYIAMINFIQPLAQPITCEATFQHLFLNTGFMKKENGIFLKCNPPLRENQISDYGLSYKIFCLGSDHAPHTQKEKTESHLSGVTSLHFWSRGIKFLQENLFIEEYRINKFIFENARDLLGLDLEPRKVSLEKEVFTSDFGVAQYGFDPFRLLI